MTTYNLEPLGKNKLSLRKGRKQFKAESEADALIVSDKIVQGWRNFGYLGGVQLITNHPGAASHLVTVYSRG